MKKGKISPATLKGFRDLLPEEAALKEKVVAIIKETFASFGFLPLETPTLEYLTTLTGKYGQEGEKLLYSFQDRGKRWVGLRYDLTVPTCKVIALYQHRLIFPFKRYQIQNTFRAEKPQKGRWREFTQCDIDTFGVASPLADAEIVLVLYTTLKNLGFKDFVIELNSRRILNKVLEEIGIKEKKKRLSFLQSIDKLEKKGKSGVEEELIKKGFSPKTIKKIFPLLKKTSPSDDLKTIISFLKKNKIPSSYYRFTPWLARGLDYYTGPIFETKVEKPAIGAISGGGRYDKLVAQLGGDPTPATGTSLGLERIIQVIKETNLWPDFSPSPVKILVTIFSPELQEPAISLAFNLRKQGIATELYPNPEEKLSKQLRYADRKKIPWVAIIGPEEKKERVVAVKNLSRREEKTVSPDQIPSLLKED